MVGKHVVLKEEGRILLNKAKAAFLKSNPSTKKVSDEIVVTKALQVYAGVK